MVTMSDSIATFLVKKIDTSNIETFSVRQHRNPKGVNPHDATTFVDEEVERPLCTPQAMASDTKHSHARASLAIRTNPRMHAYRVTERSLLHSQVRTTGKPHQIRMVTEDVSAHVCNFFFFVFCDGEVATCTRTQKIGKTHVVGAVFWVRAYMLDQSPWPPHPAVFRALPLLSSNARCWPGAQLMASRNSSRGSE